ncbi:MAG TPA: ATP-dependent DNA helicase RecG [Gammaproteobacteria bacterium]
MALRDHDVFDRPVATLAGVGPRLAGQLRRLGVERIGDALTLLPQRYEDRTEVRPLGAARPGEKVLVEGVVELTEVVVRRRRSLLCRIGDGTGALTLRFFHFAPGVRERLVRGARLRCFGEVRIGPTGLEMVHPEWRTLAPGDAAADTTMTPVYPSTEGLAQQRLRRVVQQVLAIVEREPLTDYLADRLPPESPTINDALKGLHQPPPGSDFTALAAGRHPWQRRVALEELVAQRLSLKRLALGAEAEEAERIEDVGGELARLRAVLPFALTGAQEKALGEILGDLAGDKPMHRLLQGDVGSGKTVVAAAAALVAHSAGFQTAVMAPTELLAEQHFASFQSWLEPLGVRVVLLTGSLGSAARAASLEALAHGRAAVAVGTHALFQESVRFDALALVIVDEQHRFGVRQRLELKRKGKAGSTVPHQLIMTATPIPRTLAMTAYADLDCSVIDELPAGRKPIRTVAMPEQRRAELVRRVGEHCRQGRQAYWVCPLIDESELVESSAAVRLAGELEAALPDLRVGLVHGRMKAAEKDEVMRAFKEQRIDLLVATTVVEVGVDVPRATLMVIENAERMGLAQLHQLRGRVGRGELESSCVLLYKPPLSAVARQRLDLLRRTNDGFEIAQKDLELRGPGEVLGTRQTGIVQLRVADLLRDADLLPAVIRISDELLERCPERVGPLIRRWVRGAREYAKV